MDCSSLIHLKTNDRDRSPEANMNLIYVFIGGGLGSVLRYLISLALLRYKFQFPWATLASNSLACLILGVVMGISLKGSMDPNAKLILMVGICGGLSTFSSFSGESLSLMMNGKPSFAFLNIGLSLLICFLSTFGGMKIGLQFYE